MFLASTASSAWPHVYKLDFLKSNNPPRAVITATRARVQVPGHY